MNRFPTPRWTALVAVLAVGVLAALAGCARKVTSVDAGFTTLEGQPSPAVQLYVWADTPDSLVIYRDLGTAGPSPNPNLEVDTILAIVPNYAVGPGVVRALVLDGTTANGFQFYRHAGNGGLESVTDYTVQPSTKWLSTGWETYTVDDLKPGSYSPPTYVARGLLGGQVTKASPLSPSISVTAPTPKNTIRFLADPAPNDSLFQMTWTATPGAAGYWLQVYQWKSVASIEEKVRSGTPSPVLLGHLNDNLVAFLPGGATSWKLGSPGAQVFTFTPPLRGQTYYVRVTAVDAAGNVLAWMKGDRELVLGSGTYYYAPLAATTVTPHR